MYLVAQVADKMFSFFFSFLPSICQAQCNGQTQIITDVGDKDIPFCHYILLALSICIDVFCRLVEAPHKMFWAEVLVSTSVSLSEGRLHPEPSDWPP